MAPTQKSENFSFNSPRVVRSGKSFPSRYSTICLPRPGFLYGKDTSKLQHTLHSSRAHHSVKTTDKTPEIDIYYYTSDMLCFFQKISEAEFQDICGNIMAHKSAILVFWPLYGY